MARAYTQAQKFGVEMAIPDEVATLEAPPNGGPPHWALRLINGERALARAIVIASGARYRRLQLDNLAEFEATCVHYWASPLEGKLCIYRAGDHPCPAGYTANRRVYHQNITDGRTCTTCTCAILIQTKAMRGCSTNSAASGSS